MPNSTTIAETVTAGSAVGGSEGTLGRPEGGVGDSVRSSGPDWLALSPDPKDDQGAQDSCTETTDPPLIPKIFPVYAFI